jgi:hypothetical protein
VQQALFLGFLKHLARAHPERGDGTQIHLVMDNYATDKHHEVNAWLAASPGSTSTSPRPRDRG